MHRRRPARSAMVLLLVAVLVCAATVAGDRLLHGYAENRVTAELQRSLGTVEPPTVDIAGDWFLPQVVGRRFSEVHIVASGVSPPGGGPDLEQLDLRMADVAATHGYRTFTAATVQGSARVGYAALSTYSGRKLSYAGDGQRVRLTVQTTVLGVSMTAKVTGKLGLDVRAQTVDLVDPEISVAGLELPAAVTEQLLARVLKPIAVDGLPLGLRLSSITAGPDGVDCGLGARGVVVAQL
ncbi:DUF2993 domain-containing protein [Microlunatus panaciterrae]|uniref:LmeA family phospholipid-binding protein n=1 Tax=Microlunatus panaciterrae TaxID=400768 RepID=UPI0030843F3D